MERLLQSHRLLRLLSHWLSKIIVGFFLSNSACYIAGAVSPAQAAPTGTLILQDGTLSVRLTAMPLRQVMAEVSRLSGTQVRWLSGQAEEKSVSIEFTALSLPDALQRILGDTNYLLLYTPMGENTTLTQIWIFAKREGREQPEFPPRMAVQVILPPASVTQSQDTVEEQGELDSIPIDTLIQTAASALDPSERVEAIARLGGDAPADPKVENILSHLAATDSDLQVRKAAFEVLAEIESMKE